MYVCLCVCMYECRKHACINLSMYVCIHAQLYVCICTCMDEFMYAQLYICMSVCLITRTMYAGIQGRMNV